MQFLGTQVGKLDKKGRISVPASFRAALERIGSDQLVLFPSFKEPCIEAWPIAAFEQLAARLDTMDEFSEEHANLSRVLFSESQHAKPDAEGRMMLSEDFVAHAGLEEAVAFVGNGKSFKIWHPGAAKESSRASRQIASERGLSVPGNRAVKP